VQSALFSANHYLPKPDAAQFLVPAADAVFSLWIWHRFGLSYAFLAAMIFVLFLPGYWTLSHSAQHPIVAVSYAIGLVGVATVHSRHRFEHWIPSPPVRPMSSLIVHSNRLVAPKKLRYAPRSRGETTLALRTPLGVSRQTEFCRTMTGKVASRRTPQSILPALHVSAGRSGIFDMFDHFPNKSW
jgi:hypothetical protein